MIANLQAKRREVKSNTTDWVATSTVLDLSGSITVSQMRRLSGFFQSVWHRVRD